MAWAKMAWAKQIHENAASTVITSEAYQQNGKIHKMMNNTTNNQ